MIHPPGIDVIIGSTRRQRIGPLVAAWVADIGREAFPAGFGTVDLRDWHLPMEDEADIPAAGQYAFEHTRAWSQKIAAADGFVFVTPQYNWGYPAPLKNALDHLYAEWSGKPALIVTYGGHGGGKCAAQLRQVLEGLHMRPAATMPGLTLSRVQIEANHGTIEPDIEFAAHRDVVRQGFAELAALLAPG
jgi:NAD(P)H-dependent FMN reductase